MLQRFINYINRSLGDIPQESEDESIHDISSTGNWVHNLTCILADLMLKEG